MDECTASYRRVGVKAAHLFANWPASCIVAAFDDQLMGWCASSRVDMALMRVPAYEVSVPSQP